MSHEPLRAASRRVLPFFASFAALGLYLLCAAIAAAVVLGPRLKEAREARLAALAQISGEISAQQPVSEDEWNTVRKLMPEGARVGDVSADGRRMVFSYPLTTAPSAEAWALLGTQMRKLDPDRFKLEFRRLSPEDFPTFQPSDAETVRVFVLQTAMALPVIGLLCWVFRRRLDARRDFGARQAVKWCLSALAGIYVVNITLTLLAPPDAVSMDRYLDTYRPLYLELGPWFAAALMIFIAPLLEELIFRKWMLSLLPRSIGPAAAVMVGSAMFVAVHQPGSAWHASLLAAPSFAFALIWMRSRSLLLCWSTHAAMNSVGFLAMRTLM